jgi:hypothetical protein
VIVNNAFFQFEDFFLLRFNLAFIDPGPQIRPMKIKSITDKYVVDIDFGIVKKEPEQKMLLYCKTAINSPNANQLPGYSIFAEGVGIFSANFGAELSNDRYLNEVQAPAVGAGIAQIRNYVAMATAQGPFGKYSFPLVDLLELIRAKASKLNVEQMPPPDSKEG